MSIFENASQAASRINSLTLPLGTSFSGRNVGVGVDYQFSRETTRDLGGHLVRANLNGSAARLSRCPRLASARRRPRRRDRFSPRFRGCSRCSIGSALPPDTPQQLADLLRTNAELSAYGYANSIQIDVTPVRTRLGASGGWSGSGAQTAAAFGEHALQPRRVDRPHVARRRALAELLAAAR